MAATMSMAASLVSQGCGVSVARTQARITAKSVRAVCAPALASCRGLRSSLCQLSSSSACSVFTSMAVSFPPVAATSSPARNSSLVVLAGEGYKLKTHKASAKRFRVTGSGKIVRRQACRAHLLRKKTVKRKNRLAGMADVFRGDIDKVVGALPHLKVNRKA
eukprot:TRINITY_DN3334_c0_g1_i2.p1 TRINITY_DN3334_c0_g1~~TRINITY_DN3334_c0_g1_i2.p1  ORF type:complete len:176 (+),score=10.66 TRINITY_DN3334_c0_g1_i2:44-529(+)